VNTNRGLLVASYLVALFYLAWPLLAYSEIHLSIPNILGVAFIGLSLFVILTKSHALLTFVVASLNALTGVVALAWFCWALYTEPKDSPDRNLIPVVAYFTIVVPLFAAATLFVGARKNPIARDIGS
jgi:hypothetical protein